MNELLHRHAMVTLAPEAWATLMADRRDLAGDPLVAGWATSGYPLIVRRATCNDAADAIALGLPLPPSHGKRRIAVAMGREHIINAGPPPLLADVARDAPASWRACIDELVQLDPLTRTFGSLAWQHLTGLRYVTDRSDLDLLWELHREVDLDILLAGIAAIALKASMRIDGEILGAAGAVNWHELQTDGAGEILVKRRHDVQMMARAAFLAGGMA